MRRALYFVLVVLGASLTLPVTPVFGTCIHRQHQLIAQGPSPSGKRWTVTSTVHNNVGCHSWFLELDIRPNGTARGSSAWGWSIPVGGHLSSRFTIDAQDDIGDASRTFYGVVGARVRAISLQKTNGEILTIHPRLPPAGLRKRFVWLRDLRYFVRYYPRGPRGKVARLLDSRGRLIARVHGQEGGFAGLGGVL